MISKRDAEKVFRGDEFSAVSISGVWSLGLALVKLFQVELEHYEKMEGRSLSLEGKANRLAAPRSRTRGSSSCPRPRWKDMFGRLSKAG